MLVLPASIRTVPANLATRCKGRRVVGYPHNDLWPDELIIAKDTVFGFEDTLSRAGLISERDDTLSSAVIRFARELWPDACRPDGRLFYTIHAETKQERADRSAHTKTEIKRAIAVQRALGVRAKRAAGGEIEIFG